MITIADVGLLNETALLWMFYWSDRPYVFSHPLSDLNPPRPPNPFYFPFQVDMTHCYDLMKEKAVLDSLDTGAEKQWIQEERRHHANMMKENDEWNQKVRTYGISFPLPGYM